MCLICFGCHLLSKRCTKDSLGKQWNMPYPAMLKWMEILDLHQIVMGSPLNPNIILPPKLFPDVHWTRDWTWERKCPSERLWTFSCQSPGNSSVNVPVSPCVNTAEDSLEDSSQAGGHIDDVSNIETYWKKRTHISQDEKAEPSMCKTPRKTSRDLLIIIIIIKCICKAPFIQEMQLKVLYKHAYKN